MTTYYDYFYSDSEVVEPVPEVDGPPGVGSPAEPGYETLTGEDYPIIANSDNAGWVIDDANVTGLDVGNQLPAPLFEEVPGTEPEPEPEPFVNPSLTTDPELVDTWYSRVYLESEIEFNGPPGVELDPVETVSGFEFPVMDNPDGPDYIIDVSLINDFDLAARTPANLFSKINPPNEVSGPFNASYVLTPEKLVQLSDVFEPGYIGEVADAVPLIEWVLNILAIPFKLPSEVYGFEEGISIGNVTKDVLAPLLLTDKVTFSMGEIAVNFAGNSTDYLNTEYELMLPFVQDVATIDPSLIVGNVISIEGVLDVYTGDITINIYNGGNTPIDFYKTKVGRKIPFKANFDTVINDFTGFKGVYNGFLTPFIRVKKPELVEGVYNNLYSDYGVLSGYTGYAEIEEIDLKIGASLSEKNAIKTLLQNGVIVK